MKHLSQQMISKELRGSHIQRYRRKLKELLLQPGLSSIERERLNSEIQSIGKPKVYRELESPRPGALDPGPMPPVRLTIPLKQVNFESLSTFSHSKLYLFARQEGFEVNPWDTKVQVIDKILKNNQEENQ